MRASTAGLTLIEVMGAVAIIGIVFLFLSTSAFNGIASEGRAQRLLEASLVADEVLADAETQAVLGLPIELDTSEYGDLDFDGDPEYVAFVETETFDPLSWMEPRDTRFGTPPFLDPQAQVGRNAAPNPLVMQRLRIDVYQQVDLDADDELTVPLASRTTFVIDPESLALLPGAASAPETATEDEIRETLGEGADVGREQ